MMESELTSGQQKLSEIKISLLKYKFYVIAFLKIYIVALLIWNGFYSV